MGLKSWRKTIVSSIYAKQQSSPRKTRAMSLQKTAGEFVHSWASLVKRYWPRHVMKAVLSRSSSCNGTFQVLYMGLKSWRKNNHVVNIRQATIQSAQNKSHESAKDCRGVCTPLGQSGQVVLAASCYECCLIAVIFMQRHLVEAI